MQIVNLGEDYSTITGGLLKSGSTTTIEDWEFPLMQKLGAKVKPCAEVEKPAEEKETVKKKKK